MHGRPLGLDPLTRRLPSGCPTTRDKADEVRQTGARLRRDAERMKYLVGPEFEVFKDYAGVYRWRLRAGNDQVIAVSGEGFVTDASAKESISDVKRMAPEAPIHDTT